MAVYVAARILSKVRGANGEQFKPLQSGGAVSAEEYERRRPELILHESHQPAERQLSAEGSLAPPAA